MLFVITLYSRPAGSRCDPHL